MRTKTKIWLIAGISLILMGCILFGGAMSMLKWDFTKLSTLKYETNEHAIVESFKEIDIVTDTADITFVPAEETRIVCCEPSSVKHSVSVTEGVLSIRVVDERKWYEYIGISFDSPKITVYLPLREYGNLHIKESTGDVDIPGNFTFEGMDISTSTGDIRLERLSAQKLDLSVSTGKITVSGVTCAGDATIRVTTGKAVVTDMTCHNLTSTGSTGDVLLKNVIAAGKISIDRDTGDVTFDGCDGAEISVKTDTGDIKGTLLSDKIFFTHSDTGRIRVPKTTTGGKCEITTDTGNVDIRIGE